MRAFKVYLNGKKLCTAGVGDQGVLSTNVTWVCRKGEHTRAKTPDSMEEELTLDVGGLITPTEEHVRWRERAVHVGDEVRIKVVEIASVDKPRRRDRRDPARELRAQKRYVREMAKRFGWKINDDGDTRTRFRPRTTGRVGPR